MNRVMVSGLAAIALVALAGTVTAHHGTAPNYDQHKAVKIDGVVKEFWWRNPHSALFIDGSSDAGTSGTFVLEMGAPAALINQYGIPRSTFKPGDHVVIQMHPSFTTPTNGEAMQDRFWVNGKEFVSIHNNKKD